MKKIETKKKPVIRRTTNTDGDLTIAGCLDTILSHLGEPDEVLVEETGETVNVRPNEEYDYVCGRLGINPVQAELLAAIMELGISGEATAENVAGKMGCSNLRFIGLRNEIDELIARRFVRSSTSGYRGLTYRVPDEAIKRIQANEAPNGEDISGLSTSGIVRRMNNLFRDFWRDNIDADTLGIELRDILRYNPECTFVREYKRFGIDDMVECEQKLFLYMVTRRCAFGEHTFGVEDFGRLFTDSMDEDHINGGMERGELELFARGVVEHAFDEGMADNTHICFVEDTINTILSEMACSPDPAPSSRNLIGRETIAEKTLFYNEEERRQVETLTGLLQPDNFANVVARLKEKGMRTGFCVLLHGRPGTGKTESVYQIARQTGRDIFLVDVSQIKSKWVGDSEKNIRALFQEYRKIVRSRDVAPILLFNEADAIMGVRKKGAEDSVAKMDNACINIILQEMESIEGILIATTNLTENMDSAMERRFLMKIGFNKPDKAARTHIWESLVEGLEPSNAEALAAEYDFSGGQIENISRKATVNYILSGARPGIDGLRDLCDHETITGKKKERTRIGFTA